MAYILGHTKTIKRTILYGQKLVEHCVTRKNALKIEACFLNGMVDLNVLTFS